MDTEYLSSHPYRIGAIALASGIPVSTLRIWETRHAAFHPLKTGGGHRLYAEEDVQRARLFKQLGEQGHSISALARHGIPALQALLQASGNSARTADPTLPSGSVPLVVVGRALAARVASTKFGLEWLVQPVQVTDVFNDLHAWQSAAPQPTAPLVLVQASALHDGVAAQIQSLLKQHQVRQAIVLYSYAPDRLLENLRATGMVLRREPVSDYELAGLIASLLPPNGLDPLGAVAHGAPVAARKYSDETLARISASPATLLCECPRHVADLISQLASFEVYSQACLNKGPEDAGLHAYLSSISGAARALFENALERVARHEGLQLETWRPDGTDARQEN
jgi:DNA-binding transcriptional MerR regulator